MSDQLQVMDLVVNGPLKAGIRRARAGAHYAEYQKYRVEALKAQLEKRDIPEWLPPKAKLHEGLLALLDVMETRFCEQEFKEGMARVFVKVGLAPMENGDYMQYTGINKGTLPTAMRQADDLADCEFKVGDAIAQLAMQPRDEQDNDDEDEFDDGEDEDMPGAGAAAGGMPSGVEAAAEEEHAEPAGPPYAEPPYGHCKCCDWHMGSARKPTAKGWTRGWSTSKGCHYYQLNTNPSVVLSTRPVEM